MSIASPADMKGMREAARITRDTLDALERHVRPGVTTGELDAIANKVFAREGARSAPALVYGFPGTVLISINEEIVHGIPGARVIRGGDLVKLDVTVEKDGFIADAARTIVAGRGSDLAHRLADCAKEAFEAGASVARAGTRVSEIGRAVDRAVRARGLRVVQELSGHGVGRTIHEDPIVPNQYYAWQRDVLTEGLVLTIEPMISAGSSRPVTAADGWTIRTSDGSLSAHHEHTLVITTGAPLILTAA
jgi:methionyl aminopeptidase